MTLSVYALLFISLLTILIGSLVILRSPKLFLNRIFFLYTLFAACWIGSNAVFNSLNLKYAYADALFSYVVAGGTVISFCIFSIYFSKTKFGLLSKLILGISSLILLLSGIPGVVSTEVSSNYEVVTTNLLPIYGMSIVAPMLLGVVSLSRAAVSGVGTQKSRARLILFGFIGAALVGLFFNFVLPSRGDYSLVSIGPAGVLFITVSIAFAIAKQRLFDIRAYLFRALTYAYSLVAIALIYSLFFLGLSRLLGLYVPVNFGSALIYVLSTFFAVVFFQTVKGTFDIATSKIFYKDFYDSQVVLDKYGAILVSSIEIHKLLSQTRDLISGVMHCASVDGFYIYNKRLMNFDGNFVDSGASHGSSLVKLLDNEEIFPVVIDEITDELPIKALMRRMNNSIAFRLSAHSQLIGYLVIGDRLNGSSYSDKDIKLLGVIADELSIALQNALRYEEIANFNVTLQKKVEEATRELKRTNEKLQALDQAKDEFISMASHQLRTPLTSVKGYLSMVLEGDAGDITDNQRQLLAQAFASSQRMVFLIADLLNVSRLRTGKFVIEAKPTYLPDVIQTEINQLQETAASRNLTLIFNKPDKFPLLMLDETKIRQVIMNFTDNALYYTPAGGEVTLKLEELGRSVEFTVEDNGIGVPKREQHHLFNKFYRANNARKARPDGTGLGLFMAKKIIVAQGGAIIFKSVESEGSTFGFTFPKAKLRVGAPASTLH